MAHPNASWSSRVESITRRQGSVCGSRSEPWYPSAQHRIQRSPLLADAAPGRDEIRVSALVGEGVSGAPGRYSPLERARPPLPLLLLGRQLPAVPQDLQRAQGHSLWITR